MEKTMIQLQSILQPTEEVCGVPELYYHKYGNRTDFNGYFNLFYIEKRKAYTRIDNLKLQIKAVGYKSLIIVHDGIDIETISLGYGEDYCINFPYNQYQKGVFWFALIEDEAVSDRYVEGYYITEPEHYESREVNIGIDICTFKRETYVAGNLTQLKNRVLDRSGLDVSNHVKIFVIDNGKTLQQYDEVQKIVESSNGRIRIIPNMNAGGAGGFTRGMIEVLNEKNKENFTHVLLMDDDAVIEPDTLIRIYGFLSTIKDEWKNITVGGAMLREDCPYMLFCAGEWWEKGQIINTEWYLDLRDEESASCDKLTETGHEYDRYSGWWCCCYSLEVVRSDNLPIPLFIHHDDIEFGLRNRENGTVFLNGVGVWHKGWELSFPGTNKYYDTRNNLLEIALHQETAKKRTARKIVLKSLISASIHLKYKDARLVCRGVTDFLRGPEWLYIQNPDKLNMEIRNMTYKMYSLEDLQQCLSAEEYDSVKQQILECQNRTDIDEVVRNRRRKSKATLLHLISYNGWLLPAKQKSIKMISPTDSPFDTFRQKKVVLYELSSGKVFLVRKDYKELFKLVGIYLKTFFALEQKFNRAVSSYQTGIQRITNKKAWEEYLEQR